MGRVQDWSRRRARTIDQFDQQAYMRKNREWIARHSVAHRQKKRPVRSVETVRVVADIEQVDPADPFSQVAGPDLDTPPWDD
jgi:hypothetical protein